MKSKKKAHFDNREWVKYLDIARDLVKRNDAMEAATMAVTAEENHTIMCLRAEVTARNAANQVLRERVDYLEEGMRQAKEQIKRLTEIVARNEDSLAGIPFPHDAETDPAAPGK